MKRQLLQHAVAALRPGRIKPRHEQPGNLLRDGGVFVQRRFNVTLAESKPQLLEIACVGAQHRDGPRIQRGGQHQFVEVITFHLAAPGLGKQGLKTGLHGGQIGVHRQLQAQIVNPQGIVAMADVIRMLVQHARTHALQHRQRIRQRHLGRVVNLEAQHARTGVQRAVKLHTQRRRGRQTCQHVGIFRRDGSREVLAVGRGERLRKAVRQCQSVAFAVGSQQLGGAIIFPALGKPGNAGFQCRQVHM